MFAQDVIQFFVTVARAPVPFLPALDRVLSLGLALLLSIGARVQPMLDQVHCEIYDVLDELLLILEEVHIPLEDIDDLFF